MISGPRWMGIALASSVGLNLFFAGMLTVTLLGDGRSSESVERPADVGPELLFRAADALGGNDNPKLGRVFGPRKTELVGHQRALRGAQREVRAALRADPFDEAQLGTALDALRTQTTRSQVALHSALRDLARDMTPEQRKRLATLTERSSRGAQPKQRGKAAR